MVEKNRWAHFASAKFLTHARKPRSVGHLRHASGCSVAMDRSEVVKDRLQKRKGPAGLWLLQENLVSYFQNSRLTMANPTGWANLYREQNEAIAVNS
jgi:hypothetical protein